MADYSLIINTELVGAENCFKQLKDIDTTLASIEKVAKKASNELNNFSKAMSGIKGNNIGTILKEIANTISSIGGSEINSISNELTDFSNAINGISGSNISNVSEELNNFSNAINSISTSGISNISGEIANVNNSIDRLEGNTQGATENVNSLGKAFEAVGGAAVAAKIFDFSKNFVVGTLNARAGMQGMERALTTVTGSTELANAEFTKLKDLAKTTIAIDLEGTVNAFTAFTRMGDSADEAKEKIKTLSNAVAASNGGATEINDAVVQIENLSSKTSGYDQELKKLTTTMPMVREMLHNAFGTDSAEILSQMGVTGQEVANVLFEEFGKVPEVQMGITDAFQSIQMSVSEISAALGEAFIPALMTVSELITDFAQIITDLPDWAKSLGAWVVATFGLIGVLGKAYGTVSNFIKLSKELLALTRNQATATVTRSTAEAASAVVTQTSTVAMQGSVLARAKDNALRVIETARTWLQVTAQTALNALKGPAGWAVIAGAAAITAGAVAGISALKNSGKEDTAASDNTDEQNATRAMEDAQAKYEETSKNIIDLEREKQNALSNESLNFVSSQNGAYNAIAENYKAKSYEMMEITKETKTNLEDGTSETVTKISDDWKKASFGFIADAMLAYEGKSYYYNKAFIEELDGYTKIRKISEKTAQSVVKDSEHVSDNYISAMDQIATVAAERASGIKGLFASLWGFIKTGDWGAYANEQAGELAASYVDKMNADKKKNAKTKAESDEKIAEEKEIKDFSANYDSQILDSKLAGDSIGVKKLEAEKQYMAVSNNPQATEIEKSNAYKQFQLDNQKIDEEVENERIKGEQKLSDIKEKEREKDQKNREKAVSEQKKIYEKALNEEIKTTKNAYNEIKNSIKSTLKKRESYTDKVISEAKREQKGVLSVFSKGQMAMATSVAVGGGEEDSLLTTEQIKEAKARVDKKEMTENYNKNFAEQALFGNENAVARDELKNVENQQQILEKFNVNGEYMLAQLIQMTQKLGQIYDLGLKESM